ncbi:MAG: S-adenosylmethionine:tRNA ribosyltransferase-isomerase [Bacteroidaceae bacterium]
MIDDCFYDLPHYLDKGELLVFNNTKVIRARLHFHKETGALIEVFCFGTSRSARLRTNVSGSGQMRMGVPHRQPQKVERRQPFTLK